MATSTIKNMNRDTVRIPVVQYSTGTAITIEPRPYNRIAFALPTWATSNYCGYSMNSDIVLAGATTVKFDTFADGAGNIINNGALIDIYVFLI